ncbi:MAG: GntR family transcriptional regulator, transcriptional repressor for pyruvate dehydrogenase complex [Clostridia bacterium]|jgi:GntR family transcriptional repressor for pyruvate dehydrogenase complex|nr:GntR family transcriptional regulator, transcriptional repressor for pyruvate dehydrogenase complex [Clostridia bacterium]MDN5322166.1 GntR family transcriptional regulator, transcriptional repressor for pyruvate dehydrogenase complex [Clostridia bacterium]
MFKPVIQTHVSLSDKIVEQIKEMIISGKLKPGDKLPSENELCNMFNVSRTSIREAIKILSGLGFLKIKRGLGIFVEELDAGYLINQLSPILVQREDDLLDIVRVRKLLETHAAAWAAENATPKDIKAMEDAVKYSTELVESGIANKDNLSEANLNFHMILAKSTGSKVLFRIMQSLWDILSEARQITIQLPGRVHDSVAGHKEILQAIKNKDPEAAQKAMLKHLDAIEIVVSNYPEN